eukprot:TRINITY_DN4105_c0_g1_i3.p1 TRINITY_DN4105_c0_g1~~TRINITY_DN4105_c0_g1_i3.p1  ORF type:complete len:357 (+),score=37.46 TRINITY_DN4105_c0_g1_i3:64-1071(+)
MGNLSSRSAMPHTSSGEKKEDVRVEEKQQQLQETHETGSSTPTKSRVRHLPVFEHATDCYGIALTGGRLYLSDGLYRVLIVNPSSGGRLTQYGSSYRPHNNTVDIIGQSPRFNFPWGVAIDEQRDRVYVADCYNHCVVVMRLGDGIVEAIWRSSTPQVFISPCGLAYCPTTDQLYVTDYSNHCVQVLRGSDGHCVQVLGTGQGHGSDQMCCPYGVAVDSDQIYIADTLNHRVVVYAKQSGTFLFQIGQGEGNGDMQFHSPRSVSVDSEAGVVYVADCFNDRVCVYRSEDGSYVRHFQVLQADNTEAFPVNVLWHAAAGVLYVTLDNLTTLCVYKC